jgi:hypothetical protein
LKASKKLYAESSSVSVEEMCTNYDSYIKSLIAKWEHDLKVYNEEINKKKQDKLLEKVFGKEKKKKIEKKLNESPKARLKKLAAPKDKWKRLKILYELKKKFAHDITL